MAPEGIRDILGRLSRQIAKAEAAVVITSSGSRFFLRQIVESSMPSLTVLSHNELPADIKVRSRGVIA